jgi:predicted metalloprotease
MRTGLLVALALWLMLGASLGSGQVLAQSTALDDGAVTRALVDVVRAEGNGDLNRLYDMMAPESRAVIPRQAFVNWYSDADRLVPVVDPEIVSITWGNWESNLTGDLYEDVAIVEYTVAVASGGVEDVRSDALVFWNDGQFWRWFFVGMEADTGEIAAGDAWSITYESPYRTEMFRNIDMFWAQMFANAGLDYHPPVDMVGVVVEPTRTGCGLENDIEEMAVYYCTIDETIYYDPEFRDYLVELIGEYAWQHVVAHEWGHHVQKLLGLETSHDPELLGGQYTIEHELQADCLSGVFGQDAFARQIIRTGDIDQALDVISMAGDSRGTTWDDETAHGSSAQREQSFWSGYDDGLIGCHISMQTGE